MRLCHSTSTYYEDMQCESRVLPTMHALTMKALHSCTGSRPAGGIDGEAVQNRFLNTRALEGKHWRMFPGTKAIGLIDPFCTIIAQHMTDDLSIIQGKIGVTDSAPCSVNPNLHSPFTALPAIHQTHRLFVTCGMGQVDTCNLPYTKTLYIHDNCLKPLLWLIGQ